MAKWASVMRPGSVQRHPAGLSTKFSGSGAGRRNCLCGTIITRRLFHSCLQHMSFCCVRYHRFSEKFIHYDD